MVDYLFIETRDSLEYGDAYSSFELASNLAARGHRVRIFLVQNGVIPARAGAKFDSLSLATKAGVEVLADDFSLRERGIRIDELAKGISASPIEAVVDALAAGTKTLWH